MLMLDVVVVHYTMTKTELVVVVTKMRNEMSETSEARHGPGCHVIEADLMVVLHMKQKVKMHGLELHTTMELLKLRKEKILAYQIVLFFQSKLNYYQVWNTVILLEGAEYEDDKLGAPYDDEGSDDGTVQ